MAAAVASTSTLPQRHPLPRDDPAGPSSASAPLPGRARLSCVPCRKRKSKCDEIVPCSSCLLRGTAESCHLPNTTHAAPRKRSRPSAGQQNSNPVVASHPVDAATVSPTSATSSPTVHTQSASTLSSKRSADEAGLSLRPGQSSDAAEELLKLRQSVARLETLFGVHSGPEAGDRASVTDTPLAFCGADLGEPSSSQSSTATMPLRKHPDPLPRRNAQVMKELCALLPCQRDCEVMLEFLVQEADWIVTCASYQWLQPIWSRFIHGGRVEKVEAVLLAACLALAALLLSEAPHEYYKLCEPISGLHLKLMDWVLDFLRDEQETVGLEEDDQIPGQVKGKTQLLNECLVLGIALDYLRCAGQSKHEAWPLVKRPMQRLFERIGLLDESNAIWDSFDENETEIARRIVWHLVICERWGSIYADAVRHNALRYNENYVRRPQWLRTSLTSPWHASPSGLPPTTQMTRLKTPSKSVVRLFRHKTAEEIYQATELAELTIGVSSLLPGVADYISAVKKWKQQAADRGTPANGNTVGAEQSGPDHTREYLLHQGVSLVEEIKAWRNAVPQAYQEDVHLALDVDDFAACRTAAGASLIHTGVRQMLNAVTRGWVTEELLSDGSSPLLIKLQRMGVENARDSVRVIELTRSLYRCGKIVYFGCWCAYSFFNAATTLAIPLLGASRLSQEAAKAQQRLGKLVLRDRYTDTSPPPAYEKNAQSGPSSSAHSPPLSSGSVTVAALSMSEVRTLGPDILRILDILPTFNASPLGKEAMQRLQVLVESYGIGQSQGPAAGLNVDNTSLLRGVPAVDEAAAALATLSAAGSDNAAGQGISANSNHGAYDLIGAHGESTASLPSSSFVGGSDSLSQMFDSAAGWDSRGPAVFDSLFQLNDAWWDSLLSESSSHAV